MSRSDIGKNFGCLKYILISVAVFFLLLVYANPGVCQRTVCVWVFGTFGAIGYTWGLTKKYIVIEQCKRALSRQEKKYISILNERKEYENQLQRQLELLKTTYQEKVELLTNEVLRWKSPNIEVFEEQKRQEWFNFLKKHEWSRSTTEMEVEVKFIFPLLCFLGYDKTEVQLRVSIPVQEGSKKTRLVADWVVRDKYGRVLLIIEAKAPRHHLSVQVKEQARSYAFRFHAPMYIITNGVELQVFRVGVQKDTRVLLFQISDIDKYWDDLLKYVGRSSLMRLQGEDVSQSYLEEKEEKCFSCGRTIPHELDVCPWCLSFNRD